jgi:hypothetical protein
LLGSLSALLLQEFQSLPKTTQLTLSHENLPGMLAHIAKVLGDAQVNILAFLTTTSGNEGLTHLIVDRLDTAKRAFASAGLAYTETAVLQLELPNTSGALGTFVRKLAQEDINITLGYATGEKGAKKTRVVLAVSDLEKAATMR